MKSIIVSMIAAAGLIVASNAMATDMPPLAKKNGCAACHAIDKKIVGPAWMDVSKFYNGKTDKTTVGKTVKEATGGKAPADWLLTKVSHGGTGNWGTAAMIPNDPSGSKEAEIKELVQYILGLAKQ